MIVGGVFARGGSKGVPNKNLREVGGKSLVARAVEQALSMAQIETVYCSTDSSNIATEAQKFGAEVPWLRPKELSQDDSHEWDAWVHLIKWLNENESFPDYLVTVPCVAPLRTLDDLNSCVELALSSKADVVMAVSESTRNPWFNMVTIDPTSNLVNLVNEPKSRIHNRQDAPAVFDVSTVTFIIKCSYLLRSNSLYGGTTRAVVLPKNHCLDIDTEDDLVLAEYLLSRQRAE